MDNNLKEANKLKALRTIKALDKNNIDAIYTESKEKALEEVKKLISEDSITATGGSATLNECGIISFLKEKTNYIDRNDPTLTPEEKRKAELASFDADYYLLSANALTEHGEIYEVDGNGNRVAALAFGPKNVLIVVGINKIVNSLREATERVKHTASPANCIRLKINSPCAKNGVCVQESFDENHLMCKATCQDSSICSDILIVSHQRKRGRIKVIIVGEELGY